jgi:hypothetical protein
MWSLTGLALALLCAFIAWRASRRSGGFYAREVYGMEIPHHRRYAITFLAFAGFFAAAALARADVAGQAALALYAVVAVLYGASFLRGASDDAER